MGGSQNYASCPGGAPRGHGLRRWGWRRSGVFVTLLAMLVMAGCAPGPNPLDALRQQEPDAVAHAAAEYHVVASCLLDREVRRGYRPVANDRDHEGRVTITAHSSARPSAVTPRLLFEYNVGASGPGISDIEIRRTSFVHWSSADVRLRQDLTACGIAEQAQDRQG